MRPRFQRREWSGGNGSRFVRWFSGRLWAWSFALSVALVLGRVGSVGLVVGPGMLEVRYLGELAVSVPVEFGSGDPVDDAVRFGSVVWTAGPSCSP